MNETQEQKSTENLSPMVGKLTGDSKGTESVNEKENVSAMPTTREEAATGNVPAKQERKQDQTPGEARMHPKEDQLEKKPEQETKQEAGNTETTGKHCNLVVTNTGNSTDEVTNGINGKDAVTAIAAATREEEAQGDKTGAEKVTEQYQALGTAKNFSQEDQEEKKQEEEAKEEPQLQDAPAVIDQKDIELAQQLEDMDLLEPLQHYLVDDSKSMPEKRNAPSQQQMNKTRTETRPKGKERREQKPNMKQKAKKKTPGNPIVPGSCTPPTNKRKRTTETPDMDTEKSPRNKNTSTTHKIPQDELKSDTRAVASSSSSEVAISSKPGSLSFQQTHSGQLHAHSNPASSSPTTTETSASLSKAPIQSISNTNAAPASSLQEVTPVPSSPVIAEKPPSMIPAASTQIPPLTNTSRASSTQHRSSGENSNEALLGALRLFTSPEAKNPEPVQESTSTTERRQPNSVATTATKAGAKTRSSENNERADIDHKKRAREGKTIHQMTIQKRPKRSAVVSATKAGVGHRPSTAGTVGSGRLRMREFGSGNNKGIPGRPPPRQGPAKAIPRAGAPGKVRLEIVFNRASHGIIHY